MNTALVDQLVCPRCGPPFGLILLACEVRRRRVRRGELGCPNCRDSFPIEDGFGDLRPPPRLEAPGDRTRAGDTGSDGSGSRPDVERADGPPVAAAALRIAAALGVTRGPGIIVMADSHILEAAPLAGLIQDIEVILIGWAGRDLSKRPSRDESTAPAVTTLVTGSTLPLRDGSAAVVSDAVVYEWGAIGAAPPAALPTLAAA